MIHRIIQAPALALRAPSAETLRLSRWAEAYNHWCKVGFRDTTARALASVRHGADADVREWARGVMLRDTNLRDIDML